MHRNQFALAEVLSSVEKADDLIVFGIQQAEPENIKQYKNKIDPFMDGYECVYSSTYVGLAMFIYARKTNPVEGLTFFAQTLNFSGKLSQILSQDPKGAILVRMDSRNIKNPFFFVVADLPARTLKEQNIRELQEINAFVTKYNRHSAYCLFGNMQVQGETKGAQRRSGFDGSKESLSLDENPKYKEIEDTYKVNIGDRAPSAGDIHRFTDRILFHMGDRDDSVHHKEYEVVKTGNQTPAGAGSDHYAVYETFNLKLRTREPSEPRGNRSEIRPYGSEDSASQESIRRKMDRDARELVRQFMTGDLSEGGSDPHESERQSTDSRRTMPDQGGRRSSFLSDETQSHSSHLRRQQHPIAPSPTPSANYYSVIVTVPQGTNPGDSIQVEHNGVLYRVVVPQGVSAGMPFKADLYPQAPATRDTQSHTMPNAGLQTPSYFSGHPPRNSGPSSADSREYTQQLTPPNAFITGSHAPSQAPPARYSVSAHSQTMSDRGSEPSYGGDATVSGTYDTPQQFQQYVDAPHSYSPPSEQFVHRAATLQHVPQTHPVSGYSERYPPRTLPARDATIYAARRHTNQYLAGQPGAQSGPTHSYV